MQGFIFRDLPATDNKRDFNQRMQSFLERIPNHFGQYTKNFFIGMFIGALYHFEYIENKKALESRYGHIRSFYYYDESSSSSHSLLHIVFIVDNKFSYLRSVVFSKDSKLSNPSDNVRSQLDRSELLKDLSFSQKTAAKIYYKNQDGFTWEEQSRITKEKPLSSDIVNALITKFTQKGFIEIKLLPLTNLQSENINEDQVKKFGSDKIATVKTAVETYLTSSKKVYQQALEEAFKKTFGAAFVNKEAFSHGFLFGGLGLNHYLYIYPERVVGSGLVDIMLTNPINPSPIPILIEDKAGTVSAKAGIQQIVTTYADTTVPTRGFQTAKKGIIAAFNFDLKLVSSGLQLKSDEITVRVVSINPVNQIMAKFFKLFGENIDRDNKLLANLEHLYRTRYGVKDIHDYFALLVGHAISFKEKQITLNKRVFLWEDAKLHNQYGILFINLISERDGRKERLIFDLRPSATRDLRSYAGELPETKANRVIQFLKQEASQDGSAIYHLRVAIDITKKGNDFFNKLEINPLLPSFSGQMDIKENELAGRLESLYSVKCNRLFHLDGQQYEFQPEELTKALSPTRALMESEAHAQALFQGIVSGLPEEEVVIQFFAESNQSASGRADGVVKIGKLNRNKQIRNERLFVFELKYLPNVATSLSTIETLAWNALEQGKAYVHNLKSITAEENSSVIGLAIGGDSSLSSTHFLAIKQDVVKIDHVTTDEGSQSPKKLPNRKRPLESDKTGSPSFKRRCRRNTNGSCLEYSWQESDDKREVIKELLKAREKGRIILAADDYTLLILVSLTREENESGKLIVISDSIKLLETIHTILEVVSRSQDVNDYLRSVKRDFPKEGDLLENNKHLINFSELKAVLSSEQKPLFKVISSFTHAQDFSALGVNADSIAAIYLGNNPLRSESWYSLLTSDSINSPVLYRKSLLKPNIIEKHQGSLAYFRALHLAWEPEGKHSHDFILKDTLVSLGLAESFLLSINQALGKAGLGHEKNWMPLLDSIGKIKDHPAGLLFLNLQTYETRTLDVDIKPVKEFQVHLRSLYEKVNSHFVFNHEAQTTRWSIAIEQAEAIDGLNSAFLLQTLMAWSKQKDRTDANDLSQAVENTRLSKWIEIHNYIGLAQMGQGVISDVAKVVSLVKTLLSEEQMVVENSLSAFRRGLNAFFNEGLGILFNAANVVMDIGELNEAKTKAEWDVFNTQLAFDVGGLSLSLGAGAASLLGATTTAAVLGALTVPLSGLGIGITALVKAFEEVVANAQAVGNYFYQLDNAYRQLGYQKQVISENNGVMSPLYGAVIKEINFQTNTLHYGNSYLYSSHTKTGSGKSNYIFWAGYFPQIMMDKQKAFSIRDRLGYPGIQKIEGGNITTWILPSTPESYISYSWKNLPFATTRHDRGFSVLRALEEKEDFHYDFYISPSEYIIDTITPEFIRSSIKIVLDSKERRLIIPQFSSDRFIAQYLHYTLESPKTTGKTVVHLGEAASLKLVSHHASYDWELVCSHCSNPYAIQFTDKGINLYGIKVEILNPRLGNYYLQLDDKVTYKLDLAGKQLIPLEIDAAGTRNNTRLMDDYLVSHSNPSSQNLLVKIDNYPMKNNQGNNYNGTAFYSTTEDHYFYTDGLPDKALLGPYKKMNASLSVPTSLQVNFIGCIKDLCYFWAPYTYFWSSHRNTHEIVSKYPINDKKIIAASILADHSVQIEASLDIYSKEALWHGNATDYFERHITYYVKPDGELYLAALSDSNDHLLHLFENDNNKILVAENISYRVGEDWEIRQHFQQEELNHFIAAKGWEAEENSDSGKVQARFTHRLNQWVAILPGSQNSSQAMPVWIRAKNETNYQLINPGIQEKNLVCLGSLTMKNGTEVLYFYKPSHVSANDSVTSQREHTGKLFLKSHEAAPAKVLDLSILSAFSIQNRIFVVTTEQLIKELNALGKSYLTAITADWIKTRKHWWAEIPILANGRLTEAAGIITVYGLQDQSGDVLGAWYDVQIQSFIFTQPPLNKDSKQFPIHYLTRQGGFDFFFCVENGKLYQAKSYTGTVNEIFNGTQLKITLPDLSVLVTSVKTIYFQNKRWILEMQEGQIVSSGFLPANRWTLEKIGKTCFKQCEIESSSFPEHARYEDNTFQRSLLNVDSIFNRDCFNDFKEKAGFFSSSSIVNNTLALSCSMANFKDFLEAGSAPCLTVDPNKPIVAEVSTATHHWWIPREARYFFNIYAKAIQHWNYLGLCKQTEEQTWLGACFFSTEDRMIYFAPRANSRDTQAFWNRHNKNKTRMQAEFAQKQGKDHFLLVMKVDRPSDSAYANEHFMPLFAGIKTIGLLLENTTPNVSFKIHEGMLIHYDKVLLYRSHDSQAHLYFPPLKKAHRFDVKKKGSDIVLENFYPRYDLQWIFVNAMKVNAFNKTRFSFNNVKFKRKVLEAQNENRVIDTRPSDYETLETIRQVFSQYNEENLTLRYEIVVKSSQATVQHYQSASLTLEQPGVKVQQRQTDIDKFFWQPDYLWWVLGAGSITFFSVATLVASMRYGFIRRLGPARENAIPLLARVVTVTVSTPLLSKAQAYEVPTFKGLTSYSGFSEEGDCVKSETQIGLLGFCRHEKGVIYWYQAEKNASVNFERYSLNLTEEGIHYLNYENKGEWQLNLNKIKQIALDDIQHYLSPNLHKKLAEQKQQEILAAFRQQIAVTWSHYIGNGLTLHTSIGDLFQAVGLRPDWRTRDDVHFLGRGWITMQQVLSQQTFSEKLLSLSVGLSELALLHPRIQSAYAYLTNNSDFSKAKTVIRFIGDLIQLGLYNVSYLTRLLEFYFPNNESIWKLSLGLGMASHFYRLTGDLSYWYLGMALFVLPYLPTLLENLGVPITRGLHELCNKLAQVFIGQSLVNNLSEDAGRITQRDQALKRADERVRKGRERFGFFVKNESMSDENSKEQSSHTYTYAFLNSIH
jgi:hypothetical protein